jgi:2-polyprenyl-3-methyl-5-hydroxy-6-metoxy-1,4-benzoquinol methylase
MTKLSSAVSHCEICNGTEFQQIASTDRDRALLPTVICLQCGIVFTNPRPSAEELETYYRDEYRVQYKDSLRPRPKHTYRAGKVALERMRELQPLLRPGCRVLDLGAGGGEMLFMLREAGHTVCGIEPNVGYAEYAREVLQLDIQIGGYAAAQIPPGSMDVVTTFHVLEHLEHPVEAFQTMFTWLAPGGRLLAEVPNVASTCQWPKNRFHRAHLFNFTPKTLAMAGRRAGFEVIRAYTSEDGGNTIVSFMKPEASGADTSPVDGRIPGHAQEIIQLLKRHHSLRHAFSLAPYTRPFKKLARRRDEQAALATGLEGQELLRSLVAKHATTA